MALYRSYSFDSQGTSRRGSGGSATQIPPLCPPLTAQRPAQQSGAPLGRITASDFPVTVGSHSPLLRFVQSSSASNASQGPALSPSSPWSRLRQEGSEADISSLGSDDGLDSAASGTHGRAHDDDDDNAFGQSTMTASLISQATDMFNPNLYLHAQGAWDQWNKLRGAEAGVGSEDGLLGAPTSLTAESALERQEQISERASLLTSSLAQCKTYGALPPPADDSASLANRDRMLSAINQRPVYSEATLRDAMTTADIGGIPGSNLGLILIALSQLCYSIMNLFVTLLDEREGAGKPSRGPEHPPPPPIGALEVVFVECIIIWIGATLAMLIFRSPHVWLGPPGVRWLLFARGVFGFLSTLFLYISLQNLSLSDATSITFLSPLVTGVTAAVLLEEPFSRREAVAGVGSLLGVLLIAKPSFLFGEAGQKNFPSSGGGDTPPLDNSESHGDPNAKRRLLGVVIALLGVFCMSGAWVSLRKIGRSASTYHSIAWFALCSWTLSLVGMWATGETFVWPDSWLSTFFLLFVGVFSLGAQVLQTLGLQRETAGRAAAMSYLQIIFATAFQLIILGTPLEPLSVFGSIFILVNGAWVASGKGADAPAAH